ncbi:hypothetical protein AALA54_00350 [Oscillospiraceae bacterium 44-34]|jgi:hypothetical protein
MMERLWDDILARFGQDVALRGAETAACRALVQPLLDKGTDQEVHGPLGLGRQDRFLYLGPADRPLDLNTVVEWNGRAYRVQAAHRVGEGLCPHWRAVLRPGEEGLE